MGYHRELEAAIETHEGDAQARHPHPARRRLRLRLDAARHQRQGPGVLRQVRRHEHDGGAALGHRLGRADDAHGQGARLHPRGLPRRHPAGRRRPAGRHHGAAGQGAHPRRDEGRRVPPRAAGARSAHARPAGPPEREPPGDEPHGQHPLHQRPHPRRQRARSPTPAACWCRATASSAVGRCDRGDLARRRDRDRRRRRDADARHVRGAHAFLVERRRHARRHPDACRSRSTCCGAPRWPSATSRPASPRASAPPAPSRGSTW